MQQISIKLATAIALSSTLLLTACGGSSDSSGDTKSKVDTLVGYWKGECDNEYTNVTPNTTVFSDREYFQLVKHGKNELKFVQNKVRTKYRRNFYQ